MPHQAHPLAGDGPDAETPTMEVDVEEVTKEEHQDGEEDGWLSGRRHRGRVAAKRRTEVVWWETMSEGWPSLKRESEAATEGADWRRICHVRPASH